MKLYLKQKVFSWTDSFTIYDEQGNVMYTANAEFFTIGHKVHLYKGTEEIGYVQEKIMTLLPKFEMTLRNQNLGMIRKNFTLFSQSYDLDYLDWKVYGDFFALDYEVKDGENNTVMTVQKAILTWADTYCLDIADENNEEICVMILLAIDCAMCSNN